MDCAGSSKDALTKDDEAVKSSIFSLEQAFFLWLHPFGMLKKIILSKTLGSPPQTLAASV